MTTKILLFPLVAAAVFLGGIVVSDSAYSADIGIKMPEKKKDKEDDPYKDLKEKLSEDKKKLKKQARKNKDKTPQGSDDNDVERKGIGDIVKGMKKDDE